MNWHRCFKGKIKSGEPLKRHTTFKIGGKARFFVEPEDTDDLKLLLSLRNKIPLYVIGKGSNILASDKGTSGIVLRLSAPAFKKLSCCGKYLEAGSGVLLTKALLFAGGHGLSGMEFLAGIPGTLGGALAMNAGISEKIPNPKSQIPNRKTKTRSIGDLVEDVIVMDYNGNIKALPKKDIKFSYRESGLAKYIILSARLKLARGNKTKIQERIKKYINYRKGTQDLTGPSAGCVFRNPEGDSAGRLMDLCGLKGRRVEDACISSKHANFILNLGDGKAGDVLKLMDLARRKVKDRFNIILKPEIKIWH
ncbi:MAG: UDP-N-acetylmuramate dehydrogenase [Candidatus Omnitrophica bacterium]|nr:UDP-N-acetylmuramate dehydrogenase [Candidatus Omnitrophota bacterium]MDD5592304.1 UDP-N-acetylmuramate dehydrogenase [Candidatus Omnitrophota bacterium]